MLLWTFGCICPFKIEFWFLLDIYPGVELLGYIVIVFLVFWEISIWFSIVLHQFAVPPTVQEGSHFSISLPTFVVFFLMITILTGVWLYFIVILICVLLMTSDVWVSFHVLFGNLHFFFGKMYIQFFCLSFSPGFFFFFFFDVELYELFIYNPLWVFPFTVIISCSVSYHFILLVFPLLWRSF